MLTLPNYWDNNPISTTEIKMFLDADFRKTPDYSKPYCCRCQKPVNPEAAVAVTTDGYQEVTLGGNGYQGEREWIGADCARKIGLV
jgi:hypothetical protein